MYERRDIVDGLHEVGHYLETVVVSDRECEPVLTGLVDGVVDDAGDGHLVDNAAQSCNIGLIDSAQPLKLARLDYMDVQIKGVLHTVSALVDGGSQLNVIDSSIIHSLNLTPVGTISIRGIVGEPIQASLVQLQIKITNVNDEMNDDYISIMCAACDDLNESLIITLPVADQLYNAVQHSNVNEYDSDFIITPDACEVDGCVAVVTRAQSKVKCDGSYLQNSVNEADGVLSKPVNVCEDDKDGANALFLDVDEITHIKDSINPGNKNSLVEEQRSDESLEVAFKLALKGKGNYVIKDELLFKKEYYCGRELVNLVVPSKRRVSVLKLAHDTCHFAGKRTYERIILSGLTWGSSPGVGSVRTDSIKYAAKCSTCQMYARTTCFDRVPIKVVTRDAVVFRHFQMDVFGPIVPNEKLKHNFALVVICSASRYPFVFPLSKVNSRSICDALIKMFEITGLASEMVITSDNATYFRSSLMKEFMTRLGISPRFSTPYHPEGHSVAERGIQTIQSLVAKLASEHRNNWTSYLGAALWAIREVPNATTGLPPHLLVFGQLRAGPLSILRESWMSERVVQTNVNISTEKYLVDLREKLEAANEYACQHSKAEQSRFVNNYNRRTRDKAFSVGEQCLILQKDSSSSALFAQWKGPAEIIAVKSPYSYIVAYNGGQYHLHANKLRKFHVRVDSIECNNTMYATHEIIDEQAGNCNCAIIYDKDIEFGDVTVIDPPAFVKTDLLPSAKIKPESVSHLSVMEQKELFTVLDKFPDVFRETPGLCPLVEHTIPVSDDFKPKRIRAYRIPENYRAEVNRQIQELLRLGFIEPSNSPQVSPIVCVIKPKDSSGKQAIRTCVDYRYVNKFTLRNVPVIENISDILQKVGNARYISKFDANSGYHQCMVKKEDRWLTAFVCDAGVFQYCRAPFGLKGSGDTFTQAVRTIINPIKEFTKSYVDDMAVHSNDWHDHLKHTESYLTAIRKSGFTLGLNKCEFAKGNLKYIGHLVGSGERGIDPEKVYGAVERLKEPETKKQLRQIIGFFSFFRDYLYNFSFIAKPLTDLTAKRVPERIPFHQKERDALNELKSLLIEAVKHPLKVIDMSRPFSIFADSSDYSVGACLTQPIEGREYPVAFASCKLTETQQRWATVEKEAYAALWSLQKFKHWIFGNVVILYSDHNPITFLTSSTPKSSKLMRWALALQEFDVVFRHRAGVLNTAADCLSRNVS